VRRWLVALAACRTATSPPAPVASHVDTSIELADLDRSADPCTDFFQFATGGYRGAHPIP
jgi:hypothetical protein